MSSNFPVFYGIELGAGSWIENAHFEVLAADPTPVGPGRVWFNSTDKAFKYSGLNETGAVVVRSFASAEALATEVASLNSALNSEVSRAQGAEATLQGNIDTLTSALNAEVSRAQSAEGTLNTKIDTTAASLTQYVDNKVAALGAVFEYVGTVEGGAASGSAFDLATLTKKDTGDYYKVVTAGWFKLGTGAAFQANLGDGLVFNMAGGIDKIDNTDSTVQGTAGFISVTGSVDTGFVVDVDSTFKGRVSTLESGLAKEIVDRAAADTALDGRLTTVEGAVNGKIGDLTTLTTDEKTTLVGAINEVDAHADAAAAAVSAEVSRAKAAELVLTNSIADVASNLAAEVSRAQAAEGDLSTLITTAKGNLVAAINEVAAAGTGAIGALKGDINARKKTFKSTSAALVHTFVHNLDAEFVNFTVLVQRDDGVYRNDYVSVEEVDSNTLKVYVNGTARNVKVTAESAEAV